MAIKVSGTTVIDNGPVIYANGVPGAPGEVLTSTGIGITWSATSSTSGATGGGNDEIFYINSQTITENYTLPSLKNAMTAGPITINSGVNITISNNSNWVII